MKRLSRGTAQAACIALVLSGLSPSAASAVELIKKLDCALIQTEHTDGGYCLKVFNTCNTPIVSRIEEKGGIQKDGTPIRAGERGKVCSTVPFAFLGHYISGPLAEGAGDY